MFYENDGGQVFYAHINNGGIYKIVDNCGSSNPYIESSSNGNLNGYSSNGYNAVNYWWFKDGVLIDGANSASYSPTESGTYYSVIENNQGCSRQTNMINWLITGGVPGCTYANADNYNTDAELDDGSCIFSLPEVCAGDLDGNNVVNSADLLALLATYGNVC